MNIIAIPLCNLEGDVYSGDSHAIDVKEFGCGDGVEGVVLGKKGYFMSFFMNKLNALSDHKWCNHLQNVKCW